MQDVHDLQDNRQDSVSLQDRISTLNSHQLRICSKIRDHLIHQQEHETGRCSCNNLEPVHMFFSGVGGTGKSYLIETIRAHENGDKLKFAVTAPTGLAAFNVGGVTIHRLLQLPIKHESNTAYWPLPKDSRKVLTATLKHVKLFNVDEVSAMVSSLNRVVWFNERSVCWQTCYSFHPSKGLTCLNPSITKRSNLNWVA